MESGITQLTRSTAATLRRDTCAPTGTAHCAGVKSEDELGDGYIPGGANESSADLHTAVTITLITSAAMAAHELTALAYGHH